MRGAIVFLLASGVTACGTRTGLSYDTQAADADGGDSGGGALPAESYAEDLDSLYAIGLPSGNVRTLGLTCIELDDIAVDPQGTMFGVGGPIEPALYAVDEKTGFPTRVATTSVVLNALAFASDGTLYGAGGDLVFTLDPATGNARQLARYPPGYFSSGDVAVIGDRLFATVNTGADAESDTLLSIDLGTLETSLIGSTGFADVYGLASFGERLFGYTNQGQVLEIDPSTARSTLLATTGLKFLGASGS